MNRLRRKTLQALYDQLIEIKDNLESVQNEEEEYRDNMPENLQGSEKYEKADNVCENLYAAISSIEEALSSIEAALE